MKRPLLIFMLTLVVYTLTAGGHLYSPDEEILYRTTRSLALGKGLAIEPLAGSEFTRRANPPRPDGLEYAQYGIGQPLLAVPFCWAGAGLAHWGSDATWARIYRLPTGAQAPPAVELATRWACSWFNIVLGAAMAALLYLVCLELTGNAFASMLAALLYAFGSLAWPHSRPFFTESGAAFFVLVSWYGLLRGLRGRTLAWCWVAGAAAGFAVLVRMDSALAYPGLGLLLLGPIVSRMRAQGRGFLLAWISFCIPALICGAVLLSLNWLHFGGPLETGYTDQPEGVAFSTPITAGLFGFLFSVGKGIFFFSPALFLGFWGWKPLSRLVPQRNPLLVWGLALVILVPFVIQSKWQNWPGGWCWGPRHIFLIHPFLAIPLAAWLATGWGSAARILTILAFFVGGAVQLLGCSQDFLQFYQRFFRAPGDVTAFYVTYDNFDQQYWSQYYQLTFCPAPGTTPQPLPISYLPRPIQDSLYLPQWSVWAGYPRMLREGRLDNFWYHLLHGEVVTPLHNNPPKEAP